MASQTVFDFIHGVKPCHKCGAMDRNPSGACRRCARRNTIAFHQRNPTYSLVKSTAFRKANPEKGPQYSRKYRLANPDVRANYRRKNAKMIAAKCAEYNQKHHAKMAAKKRTYAIVNKEKARADANAWRKANRERDRAAHAAWRKSNPEKVAAIHAAFLKAHPERCAAWAARGRAARFQAAPKWPHPWNIEKAAAAFWHKRRVGEHVDHIVPIRGKTVCGLHVPWNLQILPGPENLCKSNRFDQRKASAEYLEVLHGLARG